jgi:hypothetical protein
MVRVLKEKSLKIKLVLNEDFDSNDAYVDVVAEKLPLSLRNPIKS